MKYNDPRLKDPTIPFSEKRKILNELKAAAGEEPLVPTPATEPPKPTHIHDADLIPDVLEREPDDIDKLLESVDILDAYNKWCGKMRPDPGNKREGIMISCPVPGHQDSNPSAWINLDKQTWYCAKCQEGGDKYTIAAYRFGHSVPVQGAEFHKLREDMAQSLGYVVTRNMAGDTVAYQPEPEPEVETEEEDQSSNVVSIAQDDILPEEDIKYPTLDWRNIVPPETFLYEYCEQASTDDSPEEYHFWHGMIALAHAVGRKVYLADSPAVYSNLMICLFGGTGYGKSKSRGYLHEVLREVVPFKDNGLDTSGCKLASVPASGEYLIRQFQHQANDPSLPKNTGVYTPVNGVVDFDEFSSLLARVKRQGSTLAPTVMQFADCANKVSTGSLTHGEFIAERPFCSITSSTQPMAVRSTLNKYDIVSGFLNRWIFVGGQRKQKTIFNTRPVDLSRAKELLKQVRAWGAVERKVWPDDTGMQAIEQLFHKKIYTAQQADESTLLARLDLLCKRLMVLFCINERTTVVTPEIVDRVEKLLDYLVSCYGILNDNVGVSLINEISEDIIRVARNLQRKGKGAPGLGRGVTARDISKYLKNYPIDKIRNTMQVMVDMEKLEVVTTPKKGPGRPTMRYRVVED